MKDVCYYVTRGSDFNIMFMFLFFSDIALLGGSNYGCTFASCELFDRVTEEWKMLPDMMVRRSAHAAVVVPHTAGRRIYVFGGCAGMGDICASSCEFFDIERNQWTMIDTAMAIGRSNFCAVLVNDDIIIICGGQAISQSTGYTSKCEQFDTRTHKFNKLPAMKYSRLGHAGVRYMGKVVIIGGHMRTCEQFDPEVGTWTGFADLNFSHRFCTASVVEDKIYVVGAERKFVEMYDGATWSYVHEIPRSSRWLQSVPLAGQFAVFTSEDHAFLIYDPTSDTWSYPSSQPIEANRWTPAVVSF